MPSLMAMLGLDASQWNARLHRARVEAKEAGREISSALSSNLKGSILGGAGAFGIEEVTRRTMEYVAHVGDLSKRLGMSTDAIQAWDWALRLSGSSIDAASGFFEKLAVARSKALAGNGEAIASFQRLGVTMEALKSERVENIAATIASTVEAGDPQKLITDLREVGGKAAGEMVAAFQSGLAQMVSDAKSAGVIISEEVIGKLKDADDAISSMWTEFRAGIAPVMAAFATFVRDAWRGLNLIARGAVGFLAFDFDTKAAKDLMDEYYEKVKAADAATEALRKKQREALNPGGLDEGDTAAAEKAAERTLKLREELARIEADTSLKQMNREEKLQELMRRREEILKRAASDISEEAQLQAAIDVAKIDDQVAGLKKQDSPKNGKAPAIDRTANQRIGAWGIAAPQSDPQLAKQTSVLEKIDGGIQKLVESNGKDKRSGGVQF